MAERAATTAAAVTLCDRDGFRWVRFGDARGQRAPRYSAPWNNGEVVRRATVEPFRRGAHCVACVPLPYFAVPMWPERLYPRLGWAGFTYRFCGACNRVLRGRCRLAVQFVVGLGKPAGECRDKEQRLAIAVSARLLCPACSARLPARPEVEGLSRYPFVAFATNDVRLALHSAIAEFADQLHTLGEPQCSVCCTPDVPFLQNRHLCANRDCKRVARAISAVHAGSGKSADAELLLLQLLHHLRERRVNVIRPLAWHRCGKKGCARPANPDLPCKRCTRVLYCSKRCRSAAAALHKRGCVSWLAVWDPRALIFVHSPRCC